MDSARKHMYTYIYAHVSPCLCPCLCLHICMFVSISYVYIDTSHSNPTPQHSFQPSPFLYFQICSLTVSNLVFISLNIFAYLLISLYGSNLSIRACWLPLWPATSTALPHKKQTNMLFNLHSSEGGKFREDLLMQKENYPLGPSGKMAGHGDIPVYPGAFVELLLRAIHCAGCWDHTCK